MAKEPIAAAADCCRPKDADCGRPDLAGRPLLSFVDAVKVMALFKVLASDTRIRMLHHLVRSGEASVSDIARALGMKPQAVSNQLQRLSDAGVVASRREGNSIFYRVKNGCVAPLLDLALCLMEDEARPRGGAMAESIEGVVRDKYGAIAGSALSGEHEGVRRIAEAFGYTAEELASIPAEANMGLSCGNPAATANLRPGEVVVDLGSGGGLDVFLAARKVGPEGRAIGIDMTPAMLERAREGARRQGLGNVEFHEATIDELPLADASADCVISNCVINLAPDKGAVLREVARVLKPGGRVAVSDIALKKPLPPEIARDLDAYVGCIAGAIPIEEYVRELKAAGFSDVEVIDAKKDLNAYAEVEGQAGCCSPPAADSPLAVIDAGCPPSPAPASAANAVHGGFAELLKRFDVNEYAASVQVYALKPRGGSRG